MKTPIKLQPGDALLIVDVQKDFLPEGSLPVPFGDEIIAPLNHYLSAFCARGLPVFFARDWHPPNHCSFKDLGGPWPPHCIQGTAGAEVVAGLHLPENAKIISKADQPGRESYSAFGGTLLDVELFGAGIKRIFVGGLATEYCVLHTVLDALRARYAVVVLRDAIRPLNLRPHDGQEAEEEMIGLGAEMITARKLAT